MKCKKNWFYNLSVILAGFLVLYALIICLGSQCRDAANPEGYLGLLIVSLCAGFVTIRFVAWTLVRLRLGEIFSEHKRWVRIVEIIVVFMVLAATVWIRIAAIQSQGHILGEEESRYYEIAGYLENGTLRTQGASYCDFLQESPHTFGYAFLLHLAFSLGGVSVNAGLYLNVCFATAGLLCLYWIGRKLSGRIGGMMVLLWGGFVPGEIEKVFDLTARTATEFFLLLCSLLLVHTLLDFDKEKGRAGACFAWYLLLGCLIAMGAVVNPVLILFGVVVLLGVIPQKMELPNKPQNDIPLLLRFLHYGWVRGILIVIPFLLLYGILFTNIEMTIDRDVSAWGPFFTAIGSGLQRLWTDFTGCFLNMTRQYAQLWNDSSVQGTWLAILLFVALLGLGALYRKAGSFHQIFVLLLLAGAALGLFQEETACYEVLVGFCYLLLAGHGIQNFFVEAGESRMQQTKEEEILAKKEEAKQRDLEAYKHVEEEVTKIREEALANVFDMNYALEHGHVIMTVSEAYGKEKSSSEKGDSSEEK